jgi:hypothetical protein
MSALQHREPGGVDVLDLPAAGHHHHSADADTLRVVVPSHWRQGGPIRLPGDIPPSTSLVVSPLWQYLALRVLASEAWLALLRTKKTNATGIALRSNVQDGRSWRRTVTSQAEDDLRVSI